MTIAGGIVLADGASRAEGGLDCNNAALCVTGGVFVGIGGRNSHITAGASSVDTVSVDNVTAGTWTLRDDAGRAAFAFTVPEASAAMVPGSPKITTGSAYTVVTGGTLARSVKTATVWRSSRPRMPTAPPAPASRSASG